LLLGLLSWPCLGQAGHPVLGELNFDEGEWVMAGVRLFNHDPHPYQERYNTFIVEETAVLKQMQKAWSFAPMFEDWCDHHYALKFYKNGKLKKTLKINLRCKYITDGVLSYHFDPALLTQHDSHYQPIPWSRITFEDVDLLRTAIRKIRDTPHAYFYEDVRPYLREGFFVVGIDSLHWRVDRDSVMHALGDRIQALTGYEDFIMKPDLAFVGPGMMKLSFRFRVYCDEITARTFERRLAANSPMKITAHWRNHLHFKMPKERYIRIMVINVNKQRYQRIMQGAQ
jgi:hypothetical protein